MKKNIFISLSLLIFISSCTTTEIPIETVDPVITLVTYDTDVKTIIDNNCTACHTNGGVANFLPLLNYTQVKTAAESGPLIARMNNVAMPMPQGGLLSAQTRAIIDKWKADGFLKN